MADTRRNLPVEVELALEVMPCQAMRRSYDGVAEPHACSHFAKWGSYHSFDYDVEGAPASPGILQQSRYAGKRPLVPELLSGCRKAPIMAVGINPNLPGWARNSRNAIHPYFEDYLQYAHYFRWRATDKLRVPMAQFDELVDGRRDGPFEIADLIAKGEVIGVEHAPVTMYEGYQSLLDGLAMRRAWDGHKLTVGEDLSYANMVACGSARWTTRPGAPDMPVMGEEGARAIVRECFFGRKYFLRQMLQTLPKVVIVFSQTTADAFVVAMREHFTKGDPRPGESIADLLKREVRIRFGVTADGEVLDARVVFSPHVSARPDDFAAAREAVIDHLDAEALAGNLELNPATGHLRRPRGDCLFCENALYSIGKCDYRAELTTLESGTVDPLADTGAARSASGDRVEHLRLLDAFVGAGSNLPAAEAETDDAIIPFDDSAASAPRLIVTGKVVTMDGGIVDDGAVYLHAGQIVAVAGQGDPMPSGFESAAKIKSEGVIYPGLADLHNHLPYNIIALWAPPRATSNRGQWLRMADYRSKVGQVMEVIAGRQDLLRALIRYVEVKLLLGGVTSGQGMHSKYRRGDRYFVGLIRNFEVPADPALPPASHTVPDIKGDADSIANFRRVLGRGNPYFFHLAEGTDDRANAQYRLLAENDLLKSNLVGIHSLGLGAGDYAALGEAGASVVWSPFSNSILYGKTIDLRALQDANARFALGSDWTPSGSRNILQEVKIASLEAEAQGVSISAEQLTRAITSEAYDMAGWGAQLGRLKAGYYADLTILDPQHDDPWENLLAANEANVRMVIIAGNPRYGDRSLMQQAGIDLTKGEGITVGGRDRVLWLQHPSSPINHVSFSAAKDALAAALADLPAARDAMVFEPFDDGSEIEIELELQPPELEWDEMEALADVALPQSVPLDLPTVIDDPDYWQRVDAIAHLPDYLKGPNGLRRFYH